MQYNRNQRFRQAILLPVLITIPLFYQLLAQTDGTYWAKNVAILDMRIRSVSSTAYIREIVVRDFDGSAALIPDFGFGPDIYSDDGKGNDLVAGDGVYSSERCFAHNPVSPFIALNTAKSVLGIIILDTQFEYTKQLENWLKNAAIPETTQLVKCNLILCGCPAPCLCFPCEWGATSWCLDWRNCPTNLVLQW